MRWVTKSKPLRNEERAVVRFAWLPTKLDGHITVWLERYIVIQQYDDVYSVWINLRKKEYDL